MQAGSLSVLPHDGSLTVGVVDDDRDVMLAYERMSLVEARSFLHRLTDAIRIAGAGGAADAIPTAGNLT